MTDTFIVLSTQRSLPMQGNDVTAQSTSGFPTALGTNAINSALDSIGVVVDTTIELSRNQVIEGLERIIKAIIEDPTTNKYFKS